MRFRPEAAKRVALVLLLTDFGLDLRHLQTRGHQAPAFAVAAASASVCLGAEQARRGDLVEVESTAGGDGAGLLELLAAPRRSRARC